MSKLRLPRTAVCGTLYSLKQQVSDVRVGFHASKYGPMELYPGALMHGMEVAKSLDALKISWITSESLDQSTSSKKPANYRQSILAYKDWDKFNNLKFYKDQYFKLTNTTNLSKQLAKAIDRVSPALYVIKGIEINHEGRVGYRLVISHCNDFSLNDITSWWVDDKFLEENFTLIDSSSIRFVILGMGL